MLATGWRTIHYLSAGVHEKSGEWQAQCGDVPDAGVRRADDGNALADAKTWSGTFSAGAREKSRGKNSGECGDWVRSSDNAVGNVADSAGPGRNDVRGILAQRARRDGFV